MKKVLLLGALLLLVTGLSGCLSHWIVDTETRLQLSNRTPFSLANLRIVATDGSAPDIGWIEDTLLAGERGRVVTRELVGDFHFEISARDSLCGQDTCWRDHSLGKRSLEGGSVQWQIRTSGSRFLIEEL